MCDLPTVVTEACQGRTWDGPGAEDLHGDRWHVREGNLFCGKKNMTALVKLCVWAMCVVGNFAALKVRLDGFGRCWLQERAGWALIKGLVHCEPDNLKFYKF